MEKLELQRVPFTRDADNKLRFLKAKMRITPNVICRIGFCLSLALDTIPPAILEDDKSRDISRYTLFGKYDVAYEALLAQWKYEVGTAISMDELCIRHMNRGALMVSA